MVEIREYLMKYRIIEDKLPVSYDISRISFTRMGNSVK